MKLIASFTKSLIACGVALTVAALATDAQAQAMKPSKAKVRAVRGDAQFKANPAADWAPLKTGATLNPGAIVETAKGGQVDLFLVDIGSVVRVTESTQLGIDKLSFSNAGEENVVETELNLKAGTILGNVKKLAAASRYDVKVPNGVCGIRGTEFKVSVSGVVYVVSGVVKVTYTPPGGQPIVVEVPAGKYFIPPTTPGQPPTVSSIPPTAKEWLEFKDLPIIIPPVGGTTITTPGGAEVKVESVPDPQVEGTPGHNDGKPNPSPTPGT